MDDLARQPGQLILRYSAEKVSQCAENQDAEIKTCLITGLLSLPLYEPELLLLAEEAL